MVWGMKPPESFGEFWPDGEFQGWSASLMNYFLRQPSDIQQALFDFPVDPMQAAMLYPHYVSQKFINQIGTRISPHPENPPLTPIRDHEAPQIFVTGDSSKGLASFIELNDRILAVDDALKQIIERLEPNVHRFFSIEIRYKNSQLPSQTYYTLAIGQYFDSFVPEQSKAQSWRPDGTDQYFYKKSKEGITGLALAKATFGKAHLWHESRMSSPLRCFSDDLKMEIEKAGLRIPPLYKMMEV